MQNLYHSDDLVITRQKDGTVFFIRPNTTPQEMMTLTANEWNQTLAMEVITNPLVARLHEVINKTEMEVIA